MFEQHQPQLSALGRAGAEGFERIATFVLCTIRMPIERASKDYALVRAGEPAASLFGHKHAALAYVRQYGVDLWRELECVYECARGEDCDDALLEIVTRIPGIGLAKGGFILQMIYGRSGCIDTHNLKRYGIAPRVFSSGHADTDRRRIPAYNAMIRKLGGTAALWNSWCEFVAARDVGYRDAEYVSALHLAPLEC